MKTGEKKILLSKNSFDFRDHERFKDEFSKNL